VLEDRPTASRIDLAGSSAGNGPGTKKAVCRQPGRPSDSAATVPYVATRMPPVHMRLWFEGEPEGGSELAELLDRARASIREALEAMGVEVIEETT
jgi:hypothetical protein